MTGNDGLNIEVDQALRSMLSDQEADQIGRFQEMLKGIDSINVLAECAPAEHSSRWTVVQKQKTGEIQDFIDQSGELKALFMGILAVGQTDEDEITILRKSFDSLKQYLGDGDDWIAQEELRIKGLERGQNLKTTPLGSLATRFSEIVEYSQEPEHDLVVSNEGIIVGDRHLAFDDVLKIADNRGRQRRRPQAELVQRMYRAMVALLVTFETQPDIKTDDGKSIVSLARVVDTLYDDASDQELFFRGLDLGSNKYPASRVRIGIHGRLSSDIDKINKLLEISGFPPLITKIKYDKSPLGNNGFVLNSAYKIALKPSESASAE